MQWNRITLALLTVTAASFFLLACASDSSDDDKEETVDIVGLWTLEPTDTCQNETLEFEDDLAFESISEDEVITGSYEFDETVKAGKRHSLTVNAETDNGGTDCLGDSEDNSGDSFIVYLDFRDGDDTMDAYAELSGGDAHATYVRE